MRGAGIDEDPLALYLKIAWRVRRPAADAGTEWRYILLCCFANFTGIGRFLKGGSYAAQDGSLSRIMKTNREDLSIVVVDDMKFNCEFIRRALQGEGYEDIRVASSAREALKLLEQKPADVLLADWVMPEMDGLELTDRIRQIDEETNHYTCILLLTARDGIGAVIEAFERGVDDYLAKPPDKQELAARIFAAGRIANLQNGLLDTMQTMRQEYGQRITIDHLTGLGNRLDAERRFTELLELVARRGGAVCCGYLSLNDAKGIRERYGEAVYAEIQRSVANRLRRMVRPADVVARISDTEFVVGMYYQEKDLIRGKTFKRLMQAINLRPVKTTKGFVSVSSAMGLCCSREGNLLESAEALMTCAGSKVDISRRTGCTEVAV
jgi:diguanylate cyclase (GGDEF)-like protein